jgi:hypothetical protein
MYCNERCGVSEISVTVAGLDLPLKISFFPSSNYYLYPRHRSRTPRYIPSLLRQLRMTVGTQKLLLDAVASDQGFLRTFNYPDYITDEVWDLLGDMLEGQTGPHVDSAVEQLMDLQREVGGRYGAKVSAVVSRAHM